MRIFFSRNDKNVEANKKNGDDRLPYFNFSIPPEQDGGVWTPFAAAWKSKSGKGYTFKFDKRFAALDQYVQDILDKVIPLDIATPDAKEEDFGAFND